MNIYTLPDNRIGRFNRVAQNTDVTNSLVYSLSKKTKYLAVRIFSSLVLGSRTPQVKKPLYFCSFPYLVSQQIFQMLLVEFGHLFLHAIKKMADHFYQST